MNNYNEEPLFIEYKKSNPRSSIIVVDNKAVLKRYIGPLKNDILFIGCVFTNAFIFHDVIDVLDGANVRCIDFKYCLFENGIITHGLKIESLINLSFVEVKKGLEFNNTHFSNAFSMMGSKVRDYFNVSGCTFEGDVHLFAISTDVISFYRSDFDKELHIRDFNDRNSISFWELKIENFYLINLSDSILKFNNVLISNFWNCISLNLLDFEIVAVTLQNNNLYFKDVNISNINRETCRFIKSEAYQANNQILAIEYKVREMEEYRKEVFKWKTIWTWLLLTLNKLSNNYGKSWVRGFCFTMICWFFFFIGFIVLRDFVGGYPVLNPAAYIKEAANYLWLLNGLSGLLDDAINTSWWLASLLVVVFLLGKVFIGYGIYQTISAFRRFGK